MSDILCTRCMPSRKRIEARLRQYEKRNSISLKKLSLLKKSMSDYFEKMNDLFEKGGWDDVGKRQHYQKLFTQINQEQMKLINGMMFQKTKLKNNACSLDDYLYPGEYLTMQFDNFLHRIPILQKYRLFAFRFNSLPETIEVQESFKLNFIRWIQKNLKTHYVTINGAECYLFVVFKQDLYDLFSDKLETQPFIEIEDKSPVSQKEPVKSDPIAIPLDITYDYLNFPCSVDLQKGIQELYTSLHKIDQGMDSPGKLARKLGTIKPLKHEEFDLHEIPQDLSLLLIGKNSIQIEKHLSSLGKEINDLTHHRICGKSDWDAFKLRMENQILSIKMIILDADLWDPTVLKEILQKFRNNTLLVHTKIILMLEPEKQGSFLYRTFKQNFNIELCEYGKLTYKPYEKLFKQTKANGKAL